jgi:hypothetical protein
MGDATPSLADRDETSASRWNSAVWLLPILLAVHAVGVWGRGLVDKEALAFILNYLADRPLAAIIFDPSLNDWGGIPGQGAELSGRFLRRAGLCPSVLVGHPVVDAD